MGRQIYETFLPNEVADNIMMPNAVENYELETCEDLEKLRAVFEDLTTRNALVTVSTATPFDRLGITFQFNTERIRSVTQLHKLCIPGRISTIRRSGSQLAAIVREIPLLESTDELKHCNMSDQGGRHAPSIMLANEDGPDRDIKGNESSESDEEHAKQVNQREIRLSENRGTMRGPNNYLHFMVAWNLPWR